jgi:hypothetical protein
MIVAFPDFEASAFSDFVGAALSEGVSLGAAANLKQIAAEAVPTARRFVRIWAWDNLG